MSGNSGLTGFLSTFLIIFYFIFNIVKFRRRRARSRRVLSVPADKIASPFTKPTATVPVSHENKLLPTSVTERIARDKTQQLPWTSNLSVNEWLLLKSLKLKPVGMVSGFAHLQLGCSLAIEMRTIASLCRYNRVSTRQAKNFENRYNISRQGFSTSCEVENYQHVLRVTCQRALDRLQEEARLYGAHAVVGIKVIPRWPAKESFQTEYIATGTAVVMEGYELPEKPLLCTTSVIEFAKLLEAGTMPVGIALGIGVYYSASSIYARLQSGSWSNQEIGEYANATYGARNIAFNAIRDDADRVGGSGILAYHTDMHVHELEVKINENQSRTDHIIEYRCIGTIIGAVADDKPKIKMTMSMNDLKQNSLEVV